MKKLNKIISLCLTSLMSLSIIHASENGVVQENSNNFGESQVKRFNSVDSKKVINLEMAYSL